jgi:hypothetical protein
MLEQAVSAMKYIILIEASAERNHHVGSHGIALRSCHTEAFFSLCLRMPFVQSQIERDERFTLSLALACEEVRNPRQLAGRLHIAGHPQVVSAMEQNLDDRRLLRVLRPIVYRCDLESQYKNLSEFGSAIQVGGWQLGGVVKWRRAQNVF